MSHTRQTVFWISTIGAFIVLIWLLRGILLPFLAAFAVAYFLDPVADWLERRGLPRLAAVIVITVIFFTLLVGSGLFLVPLIAEQAMALGQAAPGYWARLRAVAAELGQGNLGALLSSDKGLIGEAVAGARAAMVDAADALLAQIVSSGLGLINLVGLLTITPVVSFYMLLDWDRIVEQVDKFLPQRHAPTIRALARQIDRVISGYARGTATVCVILAIFYGTVLSLVGLNYGLIVGIVSGLVSFIPFVGAVVGFVAAGLLAALQFWPDPLWIGVVLALFVAGQVIEGNFLTPRLVGQNVGLHPVWVIFALLAFGAVFGFVGVLLAVPAAATLGVLVRFALGKYLDSTLYLGDEAQIASAGVAIAADLETLAPPAGTTSPVGPGTIVPPNTTPGPGADP